MLQIVFASQTGNAKNLAGVISESLHSHKIGNDVQEMSDLAPESLGTFSKLLIVTSTFGDGEPPDNGSEWMSYLKFTDQVSLSNLKFAVLALGDTYYPHFCQAGKDFEEFLLKHRATPMIRRLDCDLYYEEQYGEWLEELIGVLKLQFK